MVHIFELGDGRFIQIPCVRSVIMTKVMNSMSFDAFLKGTPQDPKSAHGDVAQGAPHKVPTPPPHKVGTRFLAAHWVDQPVWRTAIYIYGWMPVALFIRTL